MDLMSEPTTTEESAALADAVAGVLTRIEAGELTAGPAAVSFLAGARAALDAVAGRRPFVFPESDAGT